MQTASYQTIRKNSRLTDFEQTKTLVVENSVKNVPEMVKAKSRDTNSVLKSFF